MVEIQPYEFKKKTNIEEHNDIVDKVNEIVGVINDTQMDTIDTRLTAVEGDVTALETEVSGLDNELATKADKSEIPDVSNFITADALTPYAKTVDVDNADITGVDATINNGEITIKLTRPDGDMSDSIDCPFIQTATLIPTSTARAFKIRFTYTDGTQYDTNEFVIPEGGGTDVSVTGVTVGDGTAPNSFKVTIQLSDASTINSNDYVIEFPENTDTYPTTLTGTLSGTTLNLTIGLNNGSNVQGTANLSALLTGYATTSYVDEQVSAKLDKTTADGYYQPKGNYLTTIPIGGTTIGGVKNGGNVTIESDGTMNASGGSDTPIIVNSINDLLTQLQDTANNYKSIFAYITISGGAGFFINGIITNTDPILGILLCNTVSSPVSTANANINICGLGVNVGVLSALTASTSSSDWINIKEVIFAMIK